jgi:DNA-binding transcriptional LysR family regulator
MLLSNEPLDLIAKEIDVALRGGNLPDSNLAARRLSVFRTQIYASPLYLERHGEPLHPDDLQHHRTLAMQKYRRSSGSYAWTLTDGKRTADFTIDPILVANDPDALRGALLCGEGLMLNAGISVKAFAEMGHLQRVLAGWSGQEFEFNAVFPRGQVQSPKVRAFVDFLVERLNFDANYMQVLCPDRQRYEKVARDTTNTIAADLVRVGRQGGNGKTPAPAELEIEAHADQSS